MNARHTQRMFRTAKVVGWLVLYTGFATQALPAEPEVVATVGGKTIAVQEYAMALRSEMRKRYYHAKPPDAELAAFHREVADKLIDRALVVQEAGRRGIKVEKKRVDAEIKKQRQRMRQQGAGDHDNAVFWNALRADLQQDQLSAKLKEQVRSKIKPQDAQLLQYYSEHPDKFTEPERVRLSVILLRVAPSAAQPVWDEAAREAQRIHKRILGGADFAEAARLHSGDASSARGGDMGYLHKGMLSEVVEQHLSKLVPGGVTEPITVLEGVALFKLHERKQPQLHAYEKVRARAKDLWLKEEEERVWKALVAKLRSSTPITVQEKYLVPG
ncbi:MAG: peptidylprolyl isomerase [Burkholderiales bacterium]